MIREMGSGLGVRGYHKPMSKKMERRRGGGEGAHYGCGFRIKAAVAPKRLGTTALIDHGQRSRRSHHQIMTLSTFHCFIR